jgi:hypothetical protein
LTSIHWLCSSFKSSTAASCGWHHITGSIIISRSYMRCKMHMYEYNESSTKIAQDIPRHSGELNIKVEDTVNNHTLALVIYTLSTSNINTFKKTTTFYLFTQPNYNITGTRIYFSCYGFSLVLLLITQKHHKHKFNRGSTHQCRWTPLSQSTTASKHINHEAHVNLSLAITSLYPLSAN